MIGVVIRIPEWGNATILEIAWTVIGLSTLAIVAWNFSGARASLQMPVDLMDQYEVEAARVIRFGYLRREGVRFIIAIVISAIGLVGDSQASVVHPSYVTLTGLAVTGGLFVIGLVTAVQSVFDGRDRHRVRDLLLRSRRFRSSEEWEATKHDLLGESV